MFNICFIISIHYYNYYSYYSSLIIIFSEVFPPKHTDKDIDVFISPKMCWRKIFAPLFGKCFSLAKAPNVPCLFFVVHVTGYVTKDTNEDEQWAKLLPYLADFFPIGFYCCCYLYIMYTGVTRGKVRREWWMHFLSSHTQFKAVRQGKVRKCVRSRSW